MFNKKLINLLTEELAHQKKENDRLTNIIRTDMFSLRNEIGKLRLTAEPVKTFSYTRDAKELATVISKMPVKRRCGMGGACKMMIQVDPDWIKKILTSEPTEHNKPA